MKKQFAIFFMGFCLIHAHIFGFNLELNASYDNFRGMPDGSWNGNNGGFISVNFGSALYKCLNVQAGGSFGLYNWDGRQNLVFKNPKVLLRESFITAGLTSTYGPFNAGLVYDRLFANHFGIYDLNPSVDQLRFQGGYQFCCEEVGIWGAAHLATSHKRALGVPIAFRAVDQINLFWSHFFENSAKTTIWLGAPFRRSLMFHHKTAGIFTAGFAVRAPLTKRLYVDGHGGYMRARRSCGVRQSRNYSASVCIGITYLFGNGCSNCSFIYMPLANNTNFLMDSNLNQ